LKAKEAEANEQHRSIIGAFRTAAPTLVFEQIHFVAGNSRSVVESDLYTKLKRFDVQEGKIHRPFADHVTQVYEAQYQVIVTFLKHWLTCKAKHR